MPFSMADVLAAYGGSPDPENPSSGEITPGLLLRALQQADLGGSQAYGKMATDLATLPRRAIEGAAQYSPGIRREDVTDIPGSSQPADVAVAPATEAAMTLAGLGTGFAQPGSAGIFGGRLAKNAPLEKYAAADEMLAQGATREDILAKTGLTLGPDMQLRHEIPDYASRMTERMAPVEEGKAVRPGTVGRAFEHPDLYAAYPELAELPLKMNDPKAKPGYLSRGGVYYSGNEPDFLMLNQRAYTPEISKQLGDLEPGLAGMRSTALHELQHLVQNIEGFARGGTPWTPEVKTAAAGEIKQYKADIQDQLDKLVQIRRDWLGKITDADRLNKGATRLAQEFIQQNPMWGEEFFRLNQALGQADLNISFKHYQRLTGEQEANAVQARADMTPEQLAKTPLWESMEVPYSEQLQRFFEPKGRSLSTAPSFSERMGTAQDVAFADRQRGKGNILPREVGNEPPLLAPGETRGDLVGALTPGMAPAETSIADVGRNSYRDRLFAQRLDPAQRELSTVPLPEDVSGPITGVGRPFMRPDVTPTVPSPVRIAAPGIYGNPRDIAAQALGQIAPEHPALKELFGVNRRDLADIAASRTGNVDPYTLLPGWKAASRGSEVGQAVANPVNAQRLIDILAEAQKIPELRDAIGWYVMDPAFQRLAREVGTERAIQIYRPANALTAMASPGSEVPVEIGRGTAASMMAEQGRFPEFVKYGGMKPEERARARKFPPELADVPGHVYHATSQTGPMSDYLRTGEVQMQSPKVPLYIGASGVPETGFQTGLPIADVHYSGGVGSWDLRQAKKWRESMRMPEFQTVGPWYAEQVARPAGLEPVSAQALQWTTLGPHTGVESLLGAPKLELLAQNVWERAMRTGQDPQRLLDLVLQRKAHAAVPR